jgi:hypothetical protein
VISAGATALFELWKQACRNRTAIVNAKIVDLDVSRGGLLCGSPRRCLGFRLFGGSLSFITSLVARPESGV